MCFRENLRGFPIDFRRDPGATWSRRKLEGGERRIKTEEQRTERTGARSVRPGAGKLRESRPSPFFRPVQNKRPLQDRLWIRSTYNESGKLRAAVYRSISLYIGLYIGVAALDAILLTSSYVARRASGRFTLRSPSFENINSEIIFITVAAITGGNRFRAKVIRRHWTPGIRAFVEKIKSVAGSSRAVGKLGR